VTQPVPSFYIFDSDDVPCRSNMRFLVRVTRIKRISYWCQFYRRSHVREFEKACSWPIYRYDWCRNITLLSTEV